MAKDFPTDEFDSVTGVGGRHRARRTFRSRLASFGRYAIVTAAISAATIAALNFNSSSNQVADLSASSGSGQSGFNSGGLGVTVIDATTQKGLATKVANNLFAAGWNVLSAVNLNLISGTDNKPSSTATATPAPTATPGASAAPTVGDTTIVYATTTAALTAANDLLKTLGNYKVQQSSAYADPITVVIGSDYKN